MLIWATTITTFMDKKQNVNKKKFKTAVIMKDKSAHMVERITALVLGGTGTVREVLIYWDGMLLKISSKLDNLIIHGTF